MVLVQPWLCGFSDRPNPTELAEIQVAASSRPPPAATLPTSPDTFVTEQGIMALAPGLRPPVTTAVSAELTALSDRKLGVKFEQYRYGVPAAGRRAAPGPGGIRLSTGRPSAG